MADGGMSVDLGSLAEFGYNRVLEFLGKDEITTGDKEFIRTLIGVATQEASHVQCVGMPSPIPINDIYQMTRLRTGENVMDFSQIMWEGHNAVVFARPGQGKTTLLRWVFKHLNADKTKKWRPFLFTLRNKNAVQDLTTLVDLLTGRSKALDPKKGRFALLCDGYDEIPTEDRKVVSQLLQKFSALNCGNYYLTCRTFYDVYGLAAKRYEIDDFNLGDAERFIQAFSKYYKFEIPISTFLGELCARGFTSFAAHPLLLTLVCLLQSGPKSKLPANGIGLLRRSFEYMRYRWDKEKGVDRESTVPLDGEEREHILRKVAFVMDRDDIGDERVRKIARQHLQLLQYKHVNKSKLLLEGEVSKLLMETAQFYGLLVPTKTSYWGAEPKLRWEFTHNTVRDYLAACYWHQEMRFDPLKVHEWNLRAAYAACLQTDATEAIETALDRSAEVFAVSECLINNARFSSSRIAKALLLHFQKYPHRFTKTVEHDRTLFDTEQDLFYACSDELIKNLTRCALECADNASDLCLVYALSETRRRKIRLFPDTIDQIQKRFGQFTRAILVRRREGWDQLSVNTV